MRILARRVYLAGVAMCALLLSAPSLFAGDGDIILHAKNATRVVGAWSAVRDTTAADGVQLTNPDRGTAKITTAAAAPANFFELTFTPQAGRAYRLWVRGKAQNDSYQNDSAFVQFSGSVAADGTPVFRIGTTSATWVGIEQGDGTGLAGWGWSDNGYNCVGASLYFDGTPQTVRIQQREDGLSIDQIVLSPVTYWTTAPGAPKNDATILPLAAPEDVILYAKNAATVAGAWSVVADATAAGGARMANPNLGKAKITVAAAQPANYFELTFTPAINTPYRLWLRGRAENDDYRNDSAFVQFTGSVTSAGTPTYRIGTTDATWVGIEQGDGAGLAGWGWSDNAYGGDAAPIYFDGTPQRIRIQLREDGLSIDQIVLSPVTYLTGAPGAPKNDTTIVGGDGTLVPPPPPPDPLPAPLPAPGTPLALRVLNWNTHHGGYGTDGVYSPDRLATWVAQLTPDVVFLTEIEKFDSYGNEDQPEVYKRLLEAKTGKTWFYVYANEYGNWTGNGKGNVVLSSVPIEYVARFALSYDRSAGEAGITWNGRHITLLGTHLDADSASYRLTEAQQLLQLTAAEPENKILAGDMNAQSTESSMVEVKKTYADTWAAAKAAGTAIAFPGNNGETRNSRIDYIYLSKTAADLSIVSSQVFDVRDANGVMPSDHRPLMTVFLVR